MRFASLLAAVHLHHDRARECLECVSTEAERRRRSALSYLGLAAGDEVLLCTTNLALKFLLQPKWFSWTGLHDLRMLHNFLTCVTCFIQCVVAIALT